LLFELAFVDSSRTLAVIHSNAILVAEGSKSWHTGTIGLESDGLATDDKEFALWWHF
jgi:hypothetical protein